MAAARDWAWPCGAFLLAFAFVPFAQFGVDHVPGDLADARLNHWLLENAWQFLAGGSASLWHPAFFSPYPYVLGFSENLLGVAPPYAILRAAGLGPDAAFLCWFLLGYAANFAAAYWVLRRCGRSAAAATLGALVFAFALPVSSHAHHAQLHYRFGAALAIGMLVLFLEQKRWPQLLASAGWLTLQLWCGIYTGFFTALFMAAVVLAHGLVALAGGRPRDEWRALRAAQWGGLRPATFVLSLAALAGTLLLLFYPYLRVTQLYGAGRALDEIATMLPRPQSYLIADLSWLWGPLSRELPGVPARQEHQMFAGAVPWLLACAGGWLGWKRRTPGAAAVAGALGGVILATLSIGGASLWHALAALPGASAIRAVARIDVILLFALAFLGALAVERLRERARWLPVLIAVLLVAEAAAVSPNRSARQEWRERLAAAHAQLPDALPSDALLFFAQRGEPLHATDVDAMWVALQRGVPTLNGYSGFRPAGFSSRFGADCEELPRRVFHYLTFTGRAQDAAAYVDLMTRAVPVGFEGCDGMWAELGRGAILRPQ